MPERRCVNNCGRPHPHLHHAIPKSICEEGRDEPLNHIDLCFSCHMGWHDRTVTVYREVFRPEQWAWLCAHISQAWLDRWYPERPNADLPF